MVKCKPSTQVNSQQVSRNQLFSVISPGKLKCALQLAQVRTTKHLSNVLCLVACPYGSMPGVHKVFLMANVVFHLLLENNLHLKKK